MNARPLNRHLWRGRNVFFAEYVNKRPSKLAAAPGLSVSENKLIILRNGY